MPCTAYAPNLTAADNARFIYEAIPSGLFRVDNEQDRIAWRISPQPFVLSPGLAAKIENAGRDFVAFYRALNTLYNRSARGTAPAFIAEYLDRGKPEHILRLARQNRFKQDIPQLIRPDFIVTGDDNFIVTELDSIPGGMGFVGAMAVAYCKLGYDSLGGANGIPECFAAMFCAQTGLEHPTAAIVVSEESGDYRAELEWLAGAIQKRGTVDVHVCAPQDIIFTEEALFVRLPDGHEVKIDLLYRNFELFDLMNVPKQELMLYAARHNRVTLTPPPKPQLEEKLAFALFHHPGIAQLWHSELGLASGATGTYATKVGREIYERLMQVIPQTWILDPRPLPPQAVIHGLSIHDWMELVELGKSERDFAVKPSGFSELAWGSRGVKIANDLTKDEWKATLESALQSFDTTPYILQRFHKGKRFRQEYFDPASNEIRTFDGRVRLCPYYFITSDSTQKTSNSTQKEDDVRLGGVLATVAPADKRLIHGMSDAVMAPSYTSGTA